MYLLTNFITMFPCSEDTNANAQLNSTCMAQLMNTLMNMASNSRSNLCSP